MVTREVLSNPSQEIRMASPNTLRLRPRPEQTHIPCVFPKVNEQGQIEWRFLYDEDKEAYMVERDICRLEGKAFVYKVCYTNHKPPYRKERRKLLNDTVREMRTQTRGPKGKTKRAKKIYWKDAVGAAKEFIRAESLKMNQVEKTAPPQESTGG